MSDTPIYDHDPIEEIQPEVFTVRGCSDAIQNYGDYRFDNLFTRLIAPFIGFPKTIIVGPIRCGLGPQ